MATVEYQHALGPIQPPPYPVVPVINDELPYREAAEWFKRELAALSRDLPTPYRNMPRYRLVFGGKATKFWCGYRVMRYPWKRIKQQAGWFIHLRDPKTNQLLYDDRGDANLLQMPESFDDWPAEYESYKAATELHIPAIFLFDIGKQCYIVEEWIAPSVARKGWDSMRKAYNIATGETLDVLGPEPDQGAYVPILWLSLDEDGTTPEAPSNWWLEILKEAHHRRLHDPHGDKPGEGLSDSALEGHVLNTWRAKLAAVNKDEEQIGEYLEDFINSQVARDFDGPKIIMDLGTTQPQQPTGDPVLRDVADLVVAGT